MKTIITLIIGAAVVLLVAATAEAGSRNSDDVRKSGQACKT